MEEQSNHELVKNLGTILSVWAHPDDETLSCAGIMAQAVKNGQLVVCVTATRGEAGSQDPIKWPPEKLGSVRSKELFEALQLVGVRKHHWLNYPDGECQNQDEVQAAAKICELIAKYKPDTILTFGPDGLTGHPDHQAVSRWVTRAVNESDYTPVIYQAVIAQEQYDKYLCNADKKLDIFFNIEKPPLRRLIDCDLMFDCDGAALCSLKRSAIAAMPSQTESMFNTLGEEFVDKAFMYEAFVRANKE